MAERRQIGAGWIKQTDRGEYVSLSFKADELKNIDLSQCWVSLVVNNRKSSPKHPDYSILASPKGEQQQQRPQQKQGGFPKPKNSFPKAPPQNGNWDDEDPGY